MAAETTPQGSPAGGRGDWAADTAGRIEKAVATVRSATVDRLVVVARVLVYGALAAIMAVMALVLVTVAVVRLLDVWVPRGVWLPYLILGAMFSVVGLFFWSKRTVPTSKRAA